jgi:hypothetical protein
MRGEAESVRGKINLQRDRAARFRVRDHTRSRLKKNRSRKPISLDLSRREIPSPRGRAVKYFEAIEIAEVFHRGMHAPRREIPAVAFDGHSTHRLTTRS